MANKPLPLSQPEIEEAKGYRHVLDQKHRFCDESSVGFFEVCGKQKANFEELGTERLLEKLRTGASGESRRGRGDGDELRIRVFFLSFEKVNGSSTGKLKVTSDDLKELVERIGISKAFVQGLLEPQIWDGNNCCVITGENDNPKKFSLFYRGECGWDGRSQTVFVADFQTNNATYLLVDCPRDAFSRLIFDNSLAPHVVERPFALDALLLDVCLKAWQDILNRYRTCLLSYEYPSPQEVKIKTKHDLRVATNQLHNLCSDLHRLSEHLADFEERAKFLRDACQRYSGAVRKHNENSGESKWPLHEEVSSSADDALMYVISGADTSRRWAANYQNRAHLYENLLYHTAAQVDNNVNIEIARLTSAISQKVRRDSKALIVLSVLAMAFLPSNFVAQIFSMTFFNYSPNSHSGAQGYSVSKWFWLYIAITVPLTSIVFLAWKLWLRNGQRTNIEHEQLSGDLELGSVGSELPREKNAKQNMFWGLGYSNPMSRPADVENVAEGVDGEMREDHLMTIRR